MADLELLVVVLASVLLMTWTARTLRLSEPLLLLAGGVLLGLVPRFDHVQVPPDVILMLVLPALLYWESLTTSTREVRDNFRSIALSATGLVLVTALAVGAVAHALGYAWPVAFVLGAVLAPTDASAVGASVEGMPRRIVTLLRTESLLNDGTAFVLLAVGLETLTTGDPFSLTHTTIRFVESYLGGIAIGALVALVLIRVRRHLADRILHSGLSVTTPFLAFLPAAATHVSGTLAVVVCGLVTSRIGPKVIGSGERIQATSFWEVTSFLLNGALFVLVGMQTPAAVRALTSVSLLQAAAISAAVSAATAERLAGLGATVVVLARRKDRLDTVVKNIESAGGTALALGVDVTDRAAVQAAADQAAERYGKADLVFNNAGVQLISGIEELRVDDWQRQIDLNITGVMNVIAAFLPHLTESAAAGKPADLINTSSIAATRILTKFSVYSGTKAYISHLTRLLRVELGPKMVRVATIEPGMVDTELPDHVTDPDASKLMADLIHDIDVLQSADIAETVAFMAAVPRHVNLTEITILPTAQAI